MNNSTSEITNSVIRRIIVESARDLANSKLSSLDEVTYILRAMFRLRIHQIDSLGSNCDKDKLEIFQQKAYGLQFLLKADLKNSDSYHNQFTRNFKKVTREIKDKVKASFSRDDVRLRYNDYKNWSLSFKTSFNRAFQKLKLREAQALESFSDEFIFDQSSDLPLKVYKQFPEYFDDKFFKIFQLFNHYWTFRNHSDSMGYRYILNPKEKEQDLYRPPSSLVEAASIDAVHLMKRASLIHWYNNKNEANYKLDYKKQTGREPNLFDNWIDEMNVGFLQDKNISSEIFDDDDEWYL